MGPICSKASLIRPVIWEGLWRLTSPTTVVKSTPIPVYSKEMVHFQT